MRRRPSRDQSRRRGRDADGDDRRQSEPCNCQNHRRETLAVHSLLLDKRTAGTSRQSLVNETYRDGRRPATSLSESNHAALEQAAGARPSQRATATSSRLRTARYSVRLAVTAVSFENLSVHSRRPGDRQMPRERRHHRDDERVVGGASELEVKPRVELGDPRPVTERRLLLANDCSRARPGRARSQPAPRAARPRARRAGEPGARPAPR